MQEEVTTESNADSTIRFDWNRKPKKPARSLVLVDGGFLIDGKQVDDPQRVFDAVQDFASCLAEEEPDLVTAEIEDPEEFKLCVEVDDVEMMRFEGDGSIFILGKFVAVDFDAVSRIAAWIKRHRVS